MQFRLLGPLEVVADDGTRIELPAARPRALLALLLLRRNTHVRTETLVDELWGDDPPATATKTVQVYVSQLRKAVGHARLETVTGGYVLRAGDDEVDAVQFEQLVDRGAYDEALALWRGPALADVRDHCELAAGRLDEARVSAQEERLAAALESGPPARVVPELEELAAAHPYRERLQALLMLALYRAGRQADALDAYRRTRERLADDLGLEPGRELRELELAVLRHDEWLGTPHTAPSHARRRRRTIATPTLVAGGALLAAVLLAHGQHRRDPALRTFVAKVEGVLEQAHDGRVAVVHAVDAAQRCQMRQQDAAAAIEDARTNRQSILDQLAALDVPDDERARQSAALLHRAAAASFAADLSYRRALLRAHACPARLDPRATAHADALKRRFVAAFDPLAREVGAREWAAKDF